MKKAAAANPTTRSTISTYLFAENQDCDGCSPALKTNSGDRDSVFCASKPDAVVCPSELASGAAEPARCWAVLNSVRRPADGVCTPVGETRCGTGMPAATD